MKRFICFLLVVTIFLPIIGCSQKRTASNDEEMLEIIVNNLNTDVIVQIIDTIELDTAILVCYMTGNEYQAHDYGYAEFVNQGNNYRFQRTYSTMDRGMDLRSALYNNSYLFISNNEKSTGLRICIEDGEEILIQIDAIPFVYFCENALKSSNAHSSFEYNFLDKNGDELR